MKDPFEKPCKECKEDYRPEELEPYGLCPDCYDNFDRQTLEEKLEDLGIY